MYRLADGPPLGKGLLVACDPHSSGNWGCILSWLARMGQEFDDEYKDD
jgi:hypothetical protein